MAKTIAKKVKTTVKVKSNGKKDGHSDQCLGCFIVIGTMIVGMGVAMWALWSILSYLFIGM